MMPAALCAQAQAESDPIRVYFRLGASVLERDYMDNAAALDELAVRLEPFVHDSLSGKGRVRITSSVSPEGSNVVNDRLIKARAKSISEWVGERFDVEIGYIIDSMGVDWTSLIALVEQSERVPYKSEVLDILHNTPESVTQESGKVVNERQRQLERLHNGEAYDYLFENIYPKLRYAAAYTEIWITPEIVITSEKSLEFAPEGGEGLVSYKREERDSAQPMVTCQADWVTNIRHDNSEILFTVEPNTMASSRRATVVLNHYDIIHTVEVEQQGAEPSLTFTTPSTLNVEAEGGRHAVSFVANTTEEVVPVVECGVEWISSIKVDGRRISFTVAPNTIIEPREAVVVVNAVGKSYEVKVEQAAATPSVAVVDGDSNAPSSPQYVLDSSDSIKVYFRQGSSVLDHKYMNNGEALKRLADILQPYVVDDVEEVGKVRITSSASPEGSNAINDRLVKERARAIAGWIGERFDVEIGYMVDDMGVDWTSLINLVEASDEVPYKDEVLDILYNTPERVTRNGRVINERQVQLERLRKGEPYRYIYKYLYPELRYAAAYTEIWYASQMIITSDSTLLFPFQGGSGVVTFKKNVEDRVVPKVSSSAEWIRDIAPDGEKIDFVVDENTMANERQTKLYIECYGQVYEVAVIQEGAEPVFMVVADAEDGREFFSPEGGEGVVEFATNTTEEVVPEARSGAEWISNVVATSDKVTYTVAPNEVATPRTDTIVISCFDKSQRVVVTQEAAKPELRFTTETPRNIIHKGAADTVAFKTNSPEKVVPTARSEAEWISDINPTDSTITYKVARNREYEPRTATIAVGCFDQEQRITVNQQARPECSTPFYASLKTNALYDLALIPNIGAEVHLGYNFTVAANWQYSWWKNDNWKWYWRTYGGDLSVRYWFGEAARLKPLTGHHIGIYGQILTYDFLMGQRKGVMANDWSTGYGLEYGYSMPIAERFNLDFTLGVGVNTGLYYEYLPIDDCYVWQATKRRNYIGPTKLEVSLVWLFGCKNTNDMKGGGR